MMVVMMVPVEVGVNLMVTMVVLMMIVVEIGDHLMINRSRWWW